MRDQVRLLRTVVLEAIVIVSLGAAGAGCVAKSWSYVGRWEGPSRASGFLEIEANESAFLVRGTFQPRSDDSEDLRRQKRTVADIRSVGTAMFAWLTDQAGAAAAGEQTVKLEKVPVDLEKIPVTSFAGLKELLVPQYIGVLPERDGWGNPFEYRLNVKNPTAKSVMSIRSPGRDGKFSGLTYVVAAFPHADYDHDIVWADGYFVQWPQ